MDRNQVLQQIDSEIREKLKTLQFPAMHIAEGIDTAIKSAVAFESTKTLNCEYDTLKAIITKPVIEFTVHEMGFALNAVGNRCQNDFKIVSPAEYIAIQDKVHVMGGKWAAIVNPIREAIVRKYETQQRLQAGLPVRNTPKLAKA